MNFSLAKNIVYEDRDVVVINKPAGIVVHPDATHKNETMVDALLELHPEIKTVGDDPTRPGIVHRLDKDTSGVLIVAKNQAAFDHLKKEFQERRAIKNYITLAVGSLKQTQGEINLPIGRGYKTPTQRVAIQAHLPAGRQVRGQIREALTYYKVLERFPEFTLMQITPKTGRTHQIRTHLKAIGHPVACDKLYGGKLFICPMGLTRQFLHAASLELTLPSGSRIKLEADLPDDLMNTLMTLRTRLAGKS
ncbi:MAG: RluA family pseudouridine synthase [Candidatus Niyogibacteria bacterium]|nr:RluA family pseudouridine synthase [Candidatus Niyogibacteria bacterium]